MDGFWKDRCVFVTGGTGFIGGWLIRRLVELGAYVINLRRDDIKWCLLDENEGELYEKLTTVNGDVTDERLIERILNEYSVDTVFHLAAQTQVTVANNKPYETLRVNVMGTTAVLEACRMNANSIRRVIIASSDKAYGDSPWPYNEQTALHGIYPYDCSKSCVDLIAQMYRATYSNAVPSIVVTRFENVFGGGDMNYRRLIPYAISSVIHDKPIVLRSDGSNVRGYIYVEDAIDAYMMLAEEQHIDVAYNIGYGLGRTVDGVIKDILVAMDDIHHEVIRGKSSAKNEIGDQSLEVNKLCDNLEWHPKVGYAEGLQRTIAWYKEYYKK